MRASLPALLYEAQCALHTTQAGLGAKVGASRRTAQRWTAEQSRPSASQLEGLAKLLFPVNPELAAQFAAARGATLQDLGIEAPPPPPPAPAPTPPARLALSPESVVDSIVCRASEEAGVLPGPMRPAVLAAFEQAQQIGLSVDTVVTALRAKLGREPQRAQRPQRKGG